MNEVKKIISNKFLKLYQVKKVYYKDKLNKQIKNYLAKQKFINNFNVNELNSFFKNNKFPYCSVLIFKKKIVGFLGTIFSIKSSFKKKYINCNVHSWIVDKKHRAFSILLFKKILDKNFTITALSPPTRLYRTYEVMKFKKFIMIYNIIFLKTLNKFEDKNKFFISYKDDEIKKNLNKMNLKIFENHSNKKFKKMFFYKKNKKISTFIIGNISYKKKIFRVFNILYVSNKKFLKKNTKYFYKFISTKFKVNFCGEYFLNHQQSTLDKGGYINFKKKKIIYLKNKPSKFEFNNLYSELEY